MNKRWQHFIIIILVAPGSFRTNRLFLFYYITDHTLLYENPHKSQYKKKLHTMLLSFIFILPNIYFIIYRYLTSWKYRTSNFIEK